MPCAGRSSTPESTSPCSCSGTIPRFTCLSTWGDAMRLLLVEDDAMIGESLRKALRQEGHAADWVRDGAEAEAALAAQPYEFVLLDLGLPRRDGFEVLAGLRRRKDRTPVLILTARDAVADRVRGLDLGADDYLTKPFS